MNESKATKDRTLVAIFICHDMREENQLIIDSDIREAL